MNKDRRIVVVVAVALILGAALLCWTAGYPTAGAASAETEGTIRVYGEAELSAAPDSARLVLGVETRGKTAEEVVGENARRMEEILGALKKMGLAEKQLKTGAYQLYSYQEPIDPTGKTKEFTLVYQAINELKVKVEKLEDTGKIIDTAVQAGANQVNSVLFELNQAEDLKLQALQKATAQAGAKAKAIAAGAGITIKEVKNISEEMASYTPFRAQYNEMALVKGLDAAGADMTPIVPGDVQVQARVTVEYSF